MEININIKGTAYKLPEEVTARQWSMIAIMPTDEKHVVSNILGVSPMELNQLDLEDIIELYQYCAVTLKGIHSDGDPLVSIDQLEEMTFGKWIDLDVMAHKEPYIYMCEILEELGLEGVEDWPLSKAIPTFKQYMFWRASVYKNYRNLFGLDEAAPDDTETASADIERVWYNAIMLLANEDFSNIDLVTEKPYKAALNYMAWKKEKTMRELEEIKKIQKK